MAEPLASWRLPVGGLIVFVSTVFMFAPSLVSAIDPRQDGRDLDCHQTVELRGVPWAFPLWGIGMLVMGPPGPRWLGYAGVGEGAPKWHYILPTMFWTTLGSIPVRLIGFVLDGTLSPLCVPQVGWLAFELVFCSGFAYAMYHLQGRAEAEVDDAA